MKVALLYNLNRGQSEHETEFDLPITINALTNALSKEHEVIPIECIRDFSCWITRLVLEKPDIAFNVAEGFVGTAREALYPAICEQLDIMYTGPGPTELLICHNKALTKRFLTGSDVPLLWSRLLNFPEELDFLRVEKVSFPLIVKLNSEGSSLGLDDHCIVHSWNDLTRQVEKVWNKYKAGILIEQYVEGIDLSTTFIEGMGVYGPVQYTYPHGSIYDYRLKSIDNYLVGVINPKDVKPEKIREILELTQSIVCQLGMKGYGRADFRLDTNTNQLYLLEMNAQICFHPDGAFVLGVINNSKYTYDDIVLNIVRYAAENSERINNSGMRQV